jgi:hypothetical protein
MKHIAFLAFALLAACHKPVSPAEQRAQDDRDVAMVEKAQQQFAPPTPVFPQDIALGEVQAQGLAGAGCSFLATGGSQSPVLVTRPSRAVIKLDSRIVQFASDPGSASLPLGTWSHYAGKSLSLGIEATGQGGAKSDTATLDWPGKLTIRDEHERVVFISSGRLQCGG